MIDVTIVAEASPRLTPAAEYGVDAAIRELRAHGIATGLLAQRSARQEVANETVFSAAGRRDGARVLPVATVNPVQSMAVEGQVRDAVAVRFFPAEQQWAVTSEAFQRIASEIRVPLLVPVSAFGDATAIGAATANLELPVVLVGGHYTNLVDCLAAMQRWPHLYLETSRLAQYRGIETVVHSVGARRLLFGSGAPRRPIQAALNAVIAADITLDDKRAILGANATRLFGLPADDFDVPPPARAEHLVDVHAHTGLLGFPTPPWTAHAAIDMRVASSLTAIVDGIVEPPGAEPGYVVVNPNDMDGSCRAMDQHDSAVGAKLHSSYAGQPTASTDTIALMREVARRGKPLKVHVDGPAWREAIASVALEHPRWNVIVAHAGPGMPVRAVAGLVEQTRNVYVELCTSMPDLPVTREVVRRVGPERLLFGSDAPLLDPDYMLGVYTDAGADLRCTAPLARQVFGL